MRRFTVDFMGIINFIVIITLLVTGKLDTIVGILFITTQIEIKKTYKI